ncbi:hypothetical protein [Haloglomus litoreum]|uniref:hypothetical protein n=1 Tax=Haloglomus litoreum TaxID=3034026 RepID=UPI0023E8243B|nr:hypothetical protein [Haloglomus sp. DT116]
MNEKTLPEQPFQRFVLLAVADLTLDGREPVHSFDVRERCTARTADVTCAEGGVERTAVLRALESMTGDGPLTEVEATSPVGKGRPGYELELDPASIVDELVKDGSVGAYAASLRD